MTTTVDTSYIWDHSDSVELDEPVEPVEPTEQQTVEVKRGRGRPPKYATDEERDAARREQKREGKLRYYHNHREDELARLRKWYVDNRQKKLTYEADKREMRGVGVIIPSGMY